MTDVQRRDILSYTECKARPWDVWLVGSQEGQILPLFRVFSASTRIRGHAGVVDSKNKAMLPGQSRPGRPLEQNRTPNLVSAVEKVPPLFLMAKRPTSRLGTIRRRELHDDRRGPCRPGWAGFHARCQVCE